MTPLSDDLEELLEAERDIDAPPTAARERLLSRLAPALVVPAAVAAGGASAATATSTTQSAGTAAGPSLAKLKLGTVAVSAALFGGAVGAAGHAYLASALPQPFGVSARVTAPVAPAPSASAVPAEPSAIGSAPTPIASAVSQPVPSAGSNDRPRAAGSLRAERLLLEAASAALMRGDAESALRALRQHAERFPNGALAEERAALLGRARAASGKH